MSVELVLLLAFPVIGAAVLAAVGARRWAPEANVAFSGATFLAACALTVRVIGEGSYTAFGAQIDIDPFTEFLVPLTPFVSVPTS